jgi:hypothetical protein
LADSIKPVSGVSRSRDACRIRKEICAAKEKERAQKERVQKEKEQCTKNIFGILRRASIKEHCHSYFRQIGEGGLLSLTQNVKHVCLMSVLLIQNMKHVCLISVLVVEEKFQNVHDIAFAACL